MELHYASNWEITKNSFKWVLIFFEDWINHLIKEEDYEKHNHWIKVTWYEFKHLMSIKNFEENIIIKKAYKESTLKAWDKVEIIKDLEWWYCHTIWLEWKIIEIWNSWKRRITLDVGNDIKVDKTPTLYHTDELRLLSDKEYKKRTDYKKTKTYKMMFELVDKWIIKVESQKELKEYINIYN